MMALPARVEWSGPGPAPGRAGRWYTMYGLRVYSELPLPQVEEPGESAAELADLVVTLAEPGRPAPLLAGPPLAVLRCEHGSVVGARYDGPDGTWIENQSIGTFHIAPDARRIEVYLAEGVAEDLAALILVGEVAIFALFRLGRPCLHASSIVTEWGAVAFLGPKGRGKSTMVSSFLARGGALLSDDALPLLQDVDGIYGAPGLSVMKVWPETAECTLGILEDLPGLATNYDKKMLALEGRYAFASRQARLRGLYLLDRYEPAEGGGEIGVTSRALSPREGLAALLAQTSFIALFQPAEVARLLPLYARLVAQAPVRVLRYPSGFEHQAAVYAYLLGELEAA